ESVFRAGTEELRRDRDARRRAWDLYVEHVEVVLLDDDLIADDVDACRSRHGVPRDDGVSGVERSRRDDRRTIGDLVRERGGAFEVLSVGRLADELVRSLGEASEEISERD